MSEWARRNAGLDGGPGRITLQKVQTNTLDGTENEPKYAF